MLKSMSLFLRKNHLLRWWGRLSPLNWIEAFTLFLLLELPPKNSSHSMKFLFPEFALYLYKSTIRPCKEYCCHLWTGAPSCHLALLDNLQKWICRTVGPSLAASFEPLAHRQNVASLSLFIDVTFVDVHLNRFNWFHFFSFVGGLLVLLFSLFCIIFLSLPQDVTRMSMSTVSFFTHLDSGILCV